MSKVIIAVVQQMMRVHESPEAYQADVQRFMRQVKSKNAALVVFPELSGLMLAYPLISGVKRGLLKRADKRSARRASPLSRVLGRMAGTTAGALGGGMRGSLVRLLKKRHGELFDAYMTFFAELAAEYNMYVVGGSTYLYDEEVDEVRNASYLFDPRGEVVGYQEKLVLTQQEEELCSPGDQLKVLPTDLGRLGIVIGSDVLYPEPSRALAVQGADLLVTPAACPGPVLYRQVRRAFHTRVQENQLYGAISFLVGPNNLGTGQYAGRSAVLAPMELTSRYSGVFQEVGAANVESFVASECDPDALQQLWETADPPLRHRLPSASRSALVDFYATGGTVSLAYQSLEEPPQEVLPALPVEITVPDEPVEDLPVEREEVLTHVPTSMPETDEAEEELSGTTEEWPFESD